MQLDTSFIPKMFVPGFYKRNFPLPWKAFRDARWKPTARELGIEVDQVADFQANMEIERTEGWDEINDINEAVPSEIDDGNMSQTGEETEGGKSGMEPDFEHRGCKLNVSLSNFIMFINIIILYLQIQSKITLQYIN